MSLPMLAKNLTVTWGSLRFLLGCVPGSFGCTPEFCPGAPGCACGHTLTRTQSKVRPRVVNPVTMVETFYSEEQRQKRLTQGTGGQNEIGTEQGQHRQMEQGYVTFMLDMSDIGLISELIIRCHGKFKVSQGVQSDVSFQVGFANKRLAAKGSIDSPWAQKRNVSDFAIATIVKAKYSSLKIPQVDGVNDNSDNTVAEEDYNEPEEQERQALDGAVTPKATGDEEPPLNEEDDDDLDDLDQADEDPKMDDLVLAQFEKVTRTKNRWKCILKDGIMHLNNKDLVFSKATGEFDF
eukprot:Gb_40230 [translate_table: standard]